MFSKNAVALFVASWMTTQHSSHTTAVLVCHAFVPSSSSSFTRSVKVIEPLCRSPVSLWESDGDDDWYSDFNPDEYQAPAAMSSDRPQYGQPRLGGGGGGRGGGRGNYGRGYERDTSMDNSNVDVASIEGLIEDRTQARRTGNFDDADAIRDRLLSDFGVQVWDKELSWRSGCSASGSGGRRPGGRFGGHDDRRGGRGGRGGRPRRPPKDFGVKGHDYNQAQDAGPITASLSESQIDELLAERLQCKMSRNFSEADRIQDELISSGVYVHDAMKEWRADGQMFGDYVNNGRPGRERGSRNDRNKPYQQSEYSEGGDLTEDQVIAIESHVSRRAGAKMSRKFQTADKIRDELREDYNVFVDDRMRLWSVGGDFGPDAPGIQDKNREWTISTFSEPAVDDEQKQLILSQIEQRTEAKKARDYPTADAIRENLQIEYRVELNDRMREWSIGGNFGMPEKNSKSDPNRPFTRRGAGDLSEEDEVIVVAMVQERSEAKKKRDFRTADSIRDDLEATYNVKLDDKSREWRVMSDTYGLSRDSPLRADFDDTTIEYIQSKLMERMQYKQQRAYEAADEIRDELREKFNVSIDDRTREWSVEVDQFSVVDNNPRQQSPPPPDFELAEEATPPDVSDTELDAIIASAISETEPEPAEVKSLDSFTVVQLKEKLREAGLPVSGRKAELIERLSSS